MDSIKMQKSLIRLLRTEQIIKYEGLTVYDRW